MANQPKTKKEILDLYAEFLNENPSPVEHRDWLIKALDDTIEAVRLTEVKLKDNRDKMLVEYTESWNSAAKAQQRLIETFNR